MATTLRKGARAKTRRPAAPSPHRLDRHDAVLIGVVVLAALALRLLYLHEWRQYPFFSNPKIDELYNDQWARSIAAGHPYVQGAYFRAPLYPAVLGLAYRLAEPGYMLPRVLQAILGALTSLVTYLIARSLYRRAVAAAAALVAASYWMLIFYTGELLDTALVVFLDTLLVWLLLRARSARRMVPWLMAGAALGLSAIARPTVLVFAPAVIAWIAWLHRDAWRQSLRPAAAFTAGCVLAIAPVAVRNAVSGHDRVLVAWNGGLNFYAGNNPQSDGRTAAIPNGDISFWVDSSRALRAAGDALGRVPRGSEVSSYYYALGRRFIREHPGRALSLTILKARLFWSRWEIANEKNIYFWTNRFAPMLRWLPLHFAVLAPFGILGLVLSFKRARETFPLWGFVIACMASTIPFFCPARYRMPMIPVLIVLATDAAFTAFRTIRERRWRSVLAGCAVLAAAAVLVNVTPHAEPGERDFISYVMLGDGYDEAGQPERALEAYRKALAIAPMDLQAASGLGNVLTQLNRLPEGVDDFRRVLAGPRVPRAGDRDALVASLHSNLANGLVRQKNYPEAVEQYTAAIALDPAAGKGSDQFNLGLVLQALGRPDEAARAFEDALAVNPRFGRAHLALARLHASRAEWDLAIPHYRAAIEADPGNPVLQRELEGALARQSRRSR